MKKNIISRFIAGLFLTAGFSIGMVYGQKPPSGGILIGIDGYVDRQNVITTGVPFLLVSPDSRSGSMGDIGVSTSPDPYSQHWNAAKYPFLDKKATISLTYSPWLLNLVPDMSLAYLTGAYKITDVDVVSASLLYFGMGQVNFRQTAEDPEIPYYPNEFAIDAAYSRKLIDELSLSVTGRFIYSNLTLGQTVGGIETKSALAGAVDIGLFYTKDITLKNNMNSRVNFGFALTNIGSKISYTQNAASDEKDFLPAALRAGVTYGIDLDDYNSLSLSFEFNKLLVPTPPVYDTTNIRDRDHILSGKDPNVASITGIIQSFYDAPGVTSKNPDKWGTSGAKFIEEMQEFQWSIGAEYWYNKLLAIRAGYFHESKYKGARQYLTLGAGIRYNIFGLDLSYLVPVSSVTNNNPLKNTLRVSLLFNFGK
ncbi:MAG: type IX secretion system outer membrane channel protein PorV [Bacteroidales bacterium]|jgi:hypothetical protein|nr:type IX secretion system outer membrane channel protein PorV [Bacteroidales bacterium]